MIVVSRGTDVLILFRTHSNPDLSKKETSIPSESNQIVSESIETNETLDTEGHKDITVLVSDRTKAYWQNQIVRILRTSFNRKLII